MAVLSPDVKKAISELFPAFIATSSKNGIPNVSPKGSLRVLDDDTVAFAEMMSPQTLANLQENPEVAILLFNPTNWGGCRIRGKAQILDSGELVDSFRAQFAPMKMKVNKVIKIAVTEASIMPPMKAG